MSLHRKCVLCFVILCTMRCVIRCSASGIQTNNLSDDSDDDEKLKQALVLVELLKKEYAKTLLENRALREKETTTLIEESTCATTDEPASTHGSSAPEERLTISQHPAATTVDDRSTWRSMDRRSMQHLQDNPEGNVGFRPYNFFRRQIPVENYYDYPIRGLRRSDHQQSSEDDPTTVEPKDETNIDSTDTMPTDVETQRTDTHADTTYTMAEDTTSTDNIEIETTASTAPVTETESPDDNTDNTIAVKTLKNSKKEDDPVLSQVADELLLELKITKKKPRITQRTTRMEFKDFFKPTMKIHLGGSTRFSIPLSQNHAFCYTNPRNALCRTSI